MGFGDGSAQLATQIGRLSPTIAIHPDLDAKGEHERSCFPRGVLRHVVAGGRTCGKRE
jgi:hypothetical protein